MHKQALLLLMKTLGVSSIAAAAAPDIIDLNVSRSGDDLVIDWTAAGPVDGYRVYLSTDVCASATPVYDGPDPSFVAAGVLSEPSPQIYLVTTYLGADEGRPGPLVYKYGVDLTYDAATVIGNLVSLPWKSPLVNALDLCTDVHGAPGRNDVVLRVSRWLCESFGPCSPRVKFCINPSDPVFDLLSSEAYYFIPKGGSKTIVAWGRGPLGSWDLTFPAYAPTPPADWRTVSLPYDHDYADLAALAADFPEAIEVRVRDETRDCGCSWPELAHDDFYGLTRPDTASAWTGDNYDLTTRPGHGVLIATETATTWVPRQRCPPAALAGKPRRVTGTTAVKSGDDVQLRWDVDLAAVGGYSVYRVQAKTDLGAIDPVADAPLIAVPSMRPVFPVADLAALPLPDLDIYRIVARDRAGNPGDL